MPTRILLSLLSVLMMSDGIMCAAADEPMPDHAGESPPANFEQIVNLARNLRIAEAIDAIESHPAIAHGAPGDPYRCARLKMRVHEAAGMLPGTLAGDSRGIPAMDGQKTNFSSLMRGQTAYRDRLDELLESARRDITGVNLPSGDPGANQRMIGQMQLQQGDVDKALTSFRWAVLANREDPLAKAHCARALQLAGRRREAVSLLSQVDWDSVDDIDAWICLTKFYNLRTTSDQKRCVSALTRIINSAPRRVSLYLSRGSAHGRLGNATEADRDFQTALEIDPRNPKLRFEYGSFLKRQGRTKESQQQLAIADRLDPVLREVTLHKAASLQPDERLQVMRELSQQWPAHVRTCEYAFIASYQMSDWGEAESWATRCVELEPSNPVRLDIRATVYRRSNRFDEALADLSKAIELAPKDSSFREARGWVQLLKGDYESAIDDLSVALRLSPGSFQAHYLRGKSHLALDQLAEAEADLQQALKLNPDHALAIALAGQARVLQGDAAGGERLMDDAVRREPGNPTVYRIRGETWSKLGRAADADQEFKRARLLETRVEPTGGSSKT